MKELTRIKIGFFGTPSFALSFLEDLFFNNFEKLSSISNDFNNEKSLIDEKVLESNKKLNSLKKKHYYAFFLIMIMLITFISYYE